MKLCTVQHSQPRVISYRSKCLGASSPHFVVPSRLIWNSAYYGLNVYPYYFHLPHSLLSFTPPSSPIHVSKQHQEQVCPTVPKFSGTQEPSASNNCRPASLLFGREVPLLRTGAANGHISFTPYSPDDAEWSSLSG